MELVSLVTALVIGSVVGVLGWFILPDGRARPVWLVVLTSAVAAVLGTLAARALGVAQSSGVNWLEVMFQLSFAAVAVAALDRATNHRKASGRTT